MSNLEPEPKSSLQIRESLRDQLAEKLSSAIETAEDLARKAAEKEKKQKGPGRIPRSVRYYTLMGRLSETLELILKDLDTTEIANRLKRLEHSIVALEADKSRNSENQT